MKTTQTARPGFKFLGSSADDSIGVGEFIEGHTLEFDWDGGAVIVQVDGHGDEERVSVFRVIEIPDDLHWEEIY